MSIDARRAARSYRLPIYLGLCTLYTFTLLCVLFTYSYWEHLGYANNRRYLFKCVRKSLFLKKVMFIYCFVSNVIFKILMSAIIPALPLDLKILYKN